MGCFLDDGSAEVFGLHGSGWWTLYHFAVGVPSRDQRYKEYKYENEILDGVLEECVECIRR